MEAIFSILFFGIFELISIVPFIIVVFVIVKAAKNGKASTKSSNYNIENNVGRNVTNDSGLYNGEKLNSSISKPEEHNHAYVHKVEPIDEITIMNDENSTIAMLNEKREEQAKENREDDRRSDYLDRNAAKNADLHSNMSYGERKVICSYCGAENVVARGEQKTCYFCREKL
ncbi:MAG: hypothetical protein IJC76_10140 [Lachnospiraceae bacterium]|nr:hypothetical protein [Lachnospiraceae bacterium]